MNLLIDQFGSINLLPLYSVLIVVLIERHLTLADKFHPLTFAKLVALRVAYKVHSKNPGTPLQQMIAGTLAPIVLLSPFMLLLAVLIYLSEYPIFFDSLLLLLALRFTPVMMRIKKVERCLKTNKKTLAKQHLQTLVLRETAQLSPFGIAKAAIESLMLRFAAQFCCVIVLYLVGGGLLALGYRLLFEFSQCWHTKQGSYAYFGKPIRLCLALILWLPARITALCFIIGQNISQGLRALTQGKNLLCSRYFVLSLQGAALGVELGGPVFYGDNKVRLAKCGGTRPIALEDINRALNGIKKAQWVFLTLCFIACLLLNIET
ncbi:MAG: cobalamin biosynthesis protein [Paraglaciecola sp.]|nr:cobalamin biosynthesis protein [Paraglaciecola sp.]